MAISPELRQSTKSKVVKILMKKTRIIFLMVIVSYECNSITCIIFDNPNLYSYYDRDYIWSSYWYGNLFYTNKKRVIYETI